MPVRIKAITPKKLRWQDYAKAIEKELRREGDIQKRMFEKTTRTWRRKPTFKSKVFLRGRRIGVRTETDDAIYRYLDRGTRVRHAVMSRNFRPKTKYRTIGSSAGRGGMVFVSKKIRLPGIKARKFADEIAKRRERKFQKNIYNVMVKQSRKAFR